MVSYERADAIPGNSQRAERLKRLGYRFIVIIEECDEQGILCFSLSLQPVQLLLLRSREVWKVFMVKIPSRLEELLPLGAFERVLDALHHPELSQKVREAVSKVGLKDLNPLEQVQDAWQQARTWLGSLIDGDGRVSSQVINATGVLFLPDSDGAPMVPSIGLSLARSASGFIDQAHCQRRAVEVVRQCLGYEHHLWISDPWIAVCIAAKTLSPEGVLVPRSDCVRIPAVGDLYSFLTQMGIDVREVGATNGSHMQDWQEAMRQHPSRAVITSSLNALPSGESSQSRQILMEAAQAAGNAVIELLADGSVDRKLSEQYGFPLVSDRNAMQANLILLPTHLLLGGTRGMLCLGNEYSLRAMGRMANSLGAEMSGAAISANLLALQLASLEDDLDRGCVGMLRINPDNLRNRCQRLMVQLNGLGPIKSAELLDSQHPLGVSPWDRYQLSNPVILLKSQAPVTSIRDSLLTGVVDGISILTQVKNDCLVLDLRFVHPEDEHKIVVAFQSLN